MNKLSAERRAAVISALVEGNSIRATSRMTNVSKPTVLRLLADLGRVCAEYHDYAVWGLKTERVQCDEIWSFCYAKAKNVPARLAAASAPGTIGDVWTWTAIDADSKLIVSYYVGRSQRAVSRLLRDRPRAARAERRANHDGWPQAVLGRRETRV